MAVCILELLQLINNASLEYSMLCETFHFNCKQVTHKKSQIWQPEYIQTLHHCINMTYTVLQVKYNINGLPF